MDFFRGYIIAFVSIIFELILAMLVAVPFKIAWNTVAPVYLATWSESIPKEFYHLPYWHIVAILFIIKVLGDQIAKLTPKFFSSN